MLLLKHSKKLQAESGKHLVRIFTLLCHKHRCRHFWEIVLRLRFSFPESEWMYRYALAFNHFGRDGQGGIWNLKSDILRSRVFKRKSRSKVPKENKLCDDFFVNLERGCDIIGQDDSTFDELLELVKANPCASGQFSGSQMCLNP